MSLYEKIENKELNIPARFDMGSKQMTDLYKNSPGKFEMMASAFRFGYMQGIRAERAGKAVI